MNDMLDELIKERHREKQNEDFSHRVFFSPSRFLIRIRISFLTLLFLFLIRLVVKTITVYIEHIQIKLRILFSLFFPSNSIN